MAVERSELHLVWPAALFTTEARALLASGADDDALAGLLAEAFHGGRGEQLLQQVALAQPHNSWAGEEDPWASANGYQAPRPEPFTSRATAVLVAGLADDADSLPRYAPRLLFQQRQRSFEPAALTAAEWKDKFAELIAELTFLGYFEDAFGSECDDNRENPAAEGQRKLAERLGLDGVELWPLQVRSNVFDGRTGQHKDWPDEVFFDVIEALDEVVARPRQRRWHDYHDGWDYADYSRPVGKAIYRWRVNALLDRSDVPLRLAETGSDAGLLVASVGDARKELVERVLQTPDPDVRDVVAHAISQFRSREATTLDKRGANKHLADVLELRRRLLKRDLLAGDEDDLFQIANRFQIRHLSEQQKGDYDSAFLDWIFWWYLGTIELTNKLLERQTAALGPS